MIESWKQSALVAVVIIAATVAGAGLQVWALGHPLPASSPFSVIDANRLQRAGIQLEPPTSSDRPEITPEAAVAALRQGLPNIPVGQVKLLRLTLTHDLDGSIRQRLVWGIEILAEPQFSGGPADPSVPRPTQNTTKPTFWIQFYDAHDGSFIFGYSGEK